MHPRYLIPQLPLAYLWISRIGVVFTLRHQYPQMLAALFLVWVVGSSLWIYPHSMSYFNELAGGPKYLLGSNVDWGQSAYFPKDWCDDHPEARPIRIVYSCTKTPERLGIQDCHRITNPPEPGWYAMSMNNLYSSSGSHKMFRGLTPVDYIGYSIYVYYLTQSDIDCFLKNSESCDERTNEKDDDITLSMELEGE